MEILVSLFKQTDFWWETFSFFITTNQINQDTTFQEQDIVIFKARHPIATMFYLDRTTAYGYMPPQNSIDSIKAAGYLIVYEEEGQYQLEHYE